MICKIFKHFRIDGTLIEIVPFGNGNINVTYLATFHHESIQTRYIVRQINKYVFANPEIVIENAFHASDHIRKKLIEAQEQEIHHKTLTFIRAKNGKLFHIDENNNYWCIVLFIEKSLTLECVNSTDQAYLAAKQFGLFLRYLSDEDPDKYKASIPDFHNVHKRLNLLKYIIAEDPVGRVKETEYEINYILKYEGFYSNIEIELLPIRLTHNDTKINNVLFDQITSKGICVIDLDTVMPGYIIYDFGDLIRTAAASVDENNCDLSSVHLRKDLFKAIVRGFLEELHSVITKIETDNLVNGAELIIYEQAIRFLTDYLNGDLYYKTKYSEHNLLRTKNQIALLQSIQNQRQEFQSIVQQSLR